MTMLAHLAALASMLAMLRSAGALVASTQPRGVSRKLTATATTEEPVLTLYRDTNGWCPFCERVWIGLEKKGIPYDEKLINLQDKPQWYLDIVPTTLVPAIEWHDENWRADTPGSGALVWESKDILEKLDEKFAATPLRSADEEVAEVVEVLNASVGFVYGARNGTVDDKGARFAAALDALDSVLASSGGPFVRGSELSAADLALAPTLERFGEQLKVLKPEFPALDAGRPAIARWSEAMDAEPAYTRRVKGDRYSWTAVTSSFLRIFANASDAETQAKIEKADKAAAALLAESRADATVLDDKAAVAEAIAALSNNRKNVARDASDASPKTQPHVKRAKTVQAADEAIDAALARLGGEDTKRLSKDAKVAAAAIAARLCAPRDMGAPAAAALRHTLLVLAEKKPRGSRLLKALQIFFFWL